MSSLLSRQESVAVVDATNVATTTTSPTCTHPFDSVSIMLPAPPSLFFFFSVLPCSVSWTAASPPPHLFL